MQEQIMATAQLRELWDALTTEQRSAFAEGAGSSIKTIWQVVHCYRQASPTRAQELVAVLHHMGIKDRTPAGKLMRKARRSWVRPDLWG